MKRLSLNRRPLTVFAASFGLYACGGDTGAETRGEGSGSGSGVSDTDSAGTDADSGMSGSGASGSAESADSSAGTDSNSSGGDSNDSGQGTDSNSSGSSATASAGTDSSTASGTASGTSASSTSDSDSNGSASGDDGSTDDGGSGSGGGTGGEMTGLCEDLGVEVDCYTFNPNTLNVGECKPGTQVCMMIDEDLGEWTECTGDKGPSNEICDGLDNDCDGETDEDQGQTTCGEGLCRHTVDNCTDGMEAECDPFEGAMPEICDGEDNDCDGDIDEDLGDEDVTCGLGVCEHSVSNCAGGDTPECDPFEGATDETCNGLDDDCDGPIDEDLGDLTCGMGECEHTVPACIDGVPQTCDPFEGQTTETCDGLDNDCDGLIDEDLGNWTCGTGDCLTTVPKCINGVPQDEDTCVPGGVPEICGDGLDNDCDGDTDKCQEMFEGGIDQVSRPIDVVMAIDSSGSMDEEIERVQDEIQDFADAINANGAENSFILIADRDDGDTNDASDQYRLCVDPPLGGTDCADNATERFWQFDENGFSEITFVHSSNGLGRIMQQAKVGNTGGWEERVRSNSLLAFIMITDDNGGDTCVADTLPSPNAACQSGNGTIEDGDNNNECRWIDTVPNPDITYASLAADRTCGMTALKGFKTFMTNNFPARAIGTDWQFYSIISSTGDLGSLYEAYEFECSTEFADHGLEYATLSRDTGTIDKMIPLCDSDWDLAGLADDIVSSAPQDTFILAGNGGRPCTQIDPTTVTVTVNGTPLVRNVDFTYSNVTCELTFSPTDIPADGATILVTYDFL